MNEDSYKYNFLYPVGFFGLAFINTLFIQWIVYFYAPPLQNDQTKASIVGIILLAGFLLQGILNPFVGMWSDNLRHSWGRRRPVILIFSVPLAVIFYFLWVSDTITGLVLILFYCVNFMIVAQPYFSLLPTLAVEKEQRVRYSIAGVILGLAATGAALIGGPYLISRFSFSGMGITGSVVFLVTVFTTAIFIKEPEEVENKTTDFFKNLEQLTGNRSYMVYLAGIFFLLATLNTLTIISPYLSETILGKNRDYTAILNIFLFSGVIIAIILFSMFQKRFTFHSLLKYSSLAGGLEILTVSALTLVLPAGQLIIIWWIGFVITGFMLLVSMVTPSLIVSEYADHDAANRQGLFFGLNGTAVNFGNGISSVITSFILGFGHTFQDADGIKAALFFAALCAFVSWYFIHKSEKLKAGGKLNET